ncbi:MAG: triose-phosphate isomerase [Candidatus Aminicenantes bacterium]|nr:triose-phosphate isomerase [Candidatus Aminicenantes bacterium]
MNNPIIAGNWKLHKTIPEALDLVKDIKKAASEVEKAELIVIPPFTALAPVRDVLEDSKIHVGAQNVYWEEKGAYTGEVSPSMLMDAGCRFVVIGHSERRQYFGETNETVNRKIKSALPHGLAAIMCIGETQEERESEKTTEKINRQLEEGLEGLTAGDLENVIIAYEPIWAIGTGLTATPEQAEEVHAFIREFLVQNYGNDIASCAIILYGGSVKPANTYDLLAQKNINGALVGGASLDAESFIQIAKQGLKAYEEKK